MELTGRVALITGPRRIGAVVAQALAARGADVAMSYNRSREEADRTVEAIRAAGRKAVSLRADLSNPGDCARLVEEAAGALGRLDVLVNMASHYGSTKFEALTSDDWDRGLAIDLRAAFLCSHAAAPHLRAAGGGRIVNFADWLPASGRTRYLGFLPYYVAKGGVIALTEALALELAPDGILVNAVAPGPILPPAGADEHEIEAARAATPLGRWGGEQEIVKAVLFLIDTDFVTGEVVRVDGGRHLK